MRNSLSIKLISPKMSLRPMDSEFKRRMSPSLSLVTVASLTPAKHKVHIADENIEKLNFDDSPDVVGINVNVDTSERSKEISTMYRNKGVKVIFGGIHASAMADELAEFCDAVCVGEAENVWELMLDDICNDKLQKKYKSKEVTDLSKVPIPNWNTVDTSKYLYYNIVVTSRGCPFKCDFCYNSCDYVESTYRNRPIPEVIKEIKALNNKQIMFIDDNLIGNLDWIEEFLEEISPLKITWHAAVSTNLVKYPELIKRIADTGCKSLFIGFESINKNSISSVHKSQNKIEQYNSLISMLHQHKIMVNASLVFGFDNDRKEVFEDTLNWLVVNKIETMTAHILTPYPGTVFYNKLEKEGRISDKELRKYNTSNVVFKPKGMSEEELKSGYLKIYKDFYSFKNIYKRMPEQKRRRTSYLLFNLIYRKYGKLFSKFGEIGLMSKIGRLASKLSYNLE